MASSIQDLQPLLTAPPRSPTKPFKLFLFNQLTQLTNNLSLGRSNALSRAQVPELIRIKVLMNLKYNILFSFELKYRKSRLSICRTIIWFVPWMSPSISIFLGIKILLLAPVAGMVSTASRAAKNHCSVFHITGVH